jgi:glycosidase
MTTETTGISTSLEKPSRVRIYQLFVRHFGNTNETRQANGTMAENGCGKFHDINNQALASIKELGFTHLWLTGVLEQASSTAYPGRPADPPDLLKGLAGSPYAIRDYFDVSPDYARDPSNRLVEFGDLLERCRQQGLVPLIDLVPNHVARSYSSDVLPELDFGRDDDPDHFFHRHNNFFYLQKEHAGGGPPLRLPTKDRPGCDGRFPLEEHLGRVTGNNAVTWSPSIHDWYETIKLNYGHDFTTGRDTTHLPSPGADEKDVPDTWRKMDAIIEFWQEMGVGGFRVDMAHMVPLEFWSWAIARSRHRFPETYFMGEAYDGDPAKLTDREVLAGLLTSGFDAVYDHPSYQLLQQIYEGPKWANDLESLGSSTPPSHSLLRYAENHDEVRSANPQHWGGVGMGAGRAASAILFGMGTGPVMLYNGQEVGEEAIGSEGFSGDDGRSSIFDYTSLPELSKWVHGHRYDGGGLSQEQRELRQWYGRLLHACNEPAFRTGAFYGINHANKENPHFGRLGEETVSGHWCCAFLRSERHLAGQNILVIVNLHGSETIRGAQVRIPKHALNWMMIDSSALEFTDLLGSSWTGNASTRDLPSEGLALPDLPPCSALYLEIEG